MIFNWNSVCCCVLTTSRYCICMPYFLHWSINFDDAVFQYFAIHELKIWLSFSGSITITSLILTVLNLDISLMTSIKCTIFNGYENSVPYEPVLNHDTCYKPISLCSFSIMFSQNKQYGGQFQNGSFYGEIGTIARREADFAINAFTNLYSRYKVVKMSLIYTFCNIISINLP